MKALRIGPDCSSYRRNKHYDCRYLGNNRYRISGEGGSKYTYHVLNDKTGFWKIIKEEKVKQIKRLEQPTNQNHGCFTEGNIYSVDGDGYCLDDNGCKHRPNLDGIDQLKSSNRWWTVLPNYIRQDEILMHKGNTTEKKTMIKIETVTLINERKETAHTDEELIQLIKDQEDLITALDVVNVKSTAITRIKTKHRKVIAQLAGILDSRHED